MRIGRLARQIQHSTLALVLAGACPGGALARNRHTHEATAQLQRLTTAQATLLKVVRDSTERFKDVSVAEAEGYSLLFGCVSGPDRSEYPPASATDTSLNRSVEAEGYSLLFGCVSGPDAGAMGLHFV